jgi:hypothetical protein
MPKAVLDKIGITIRRGASPKIFMTWAPHVSLRPKENSLYYTLETKVFNRAKNSYSAPKKGKDNA